MRIHILSITGLALLSACGGSGTERIINILTTDETLGTQSVLGRTSAAGTEIILETPGGVVTVPIEPERAIGIFEGGLDQGEDGFAFGFIAEGEASVAAIGAFGTFEDNSSGATIQRTVDSTLPPDGTPTFSGDYVGLLISETGETVEGAGVTGLATLTADFEQETVSGLISQRTPTGVVSDEQILPGSSATDILLTETAITDQGTFSGSSSGGEIADPSNIIGDSTVSNGSFSGLFAGQEAAEAVGGLELTHTFAEQTFIELGVFAVTQ